MLNLLLTCDFCLNRNKQKIADIHCLEIVGGPPTFMSAVLSYCLFFVLMDFFLENKVKVGSKAAKKNKKRKSKKPVNEKCNERETVDLNCMLTELKKQLEEAKSTKVFKQTLL